MLYQRMEILHAGGLLSDEIKVFMNEIIVYFQEKHPNITQEAATMLMTHLAMASQRILQGNIVGMMDDVLFEEVRQSTGYDKALEVMSYIERSSVLTYPESEKQFIILHLSNLF